MDDVRAAFAVGGVPLHPQWPEPRWPLGVLQVVFAPPRKLDVGLLPGGCRLYPPDEARVRWHTSIDPVSELALSTGFIRQLADSSQVPLALVSDTVTSGFLRTKPQTQGLWDHHIVFDVQAAARAMHGLRTVRYAEWALWKLGALLLSPFERTLYLDADIVLLSGSLVHDLLHNSLRLYDMAMPVDVGRPGNKFSKRKSMRRIFYTTENQQLRNGSNEDKPALSPNMFAHGFPPMCTCIMAFRRERSVKRLIMRASARLVNRSNLVDPTVHEHRSFVRQTDQEMVWFELFEGEVAKLPRVLMLPEEYYCPATSTGEQAFDYTDLILSNRLPAWTVPGVTYGSTCTKRKECVKRPNDRYLAGGVKDCHAAHMHWSIRRFEGYNLTSPRTGLPGNLSVDWVTRCLDAELWCRRRNQHGVVPQCTVRCDAPPARTLGYPLVHPATPSAQNAPAQPTLHRAKVCPGLGGADEDDASQGKKMPRNRRRGRKTSVA